MTDQKTQCAECASLLSARLEANMERNRANQLGKNCMWLIAKIDRIHAALCQGENGTWQMRVEQAVEAAEKIKAPNMELTRLAVGQSGGAKRNES